MLKHTSSDYGLEDKETLLKQQKWQLASALATQLELADKGKNSVVLCKLLGNAAVGWWSYPW